MVRLQRLTGIWVECIDIPPSEAMLLLAQTPDTYLRQDRESIWARGDKRRCEKRKSSDLSY